MTSSACHGDLCVNNKSAHVVGGGRHIENYSNSAIPIRSWFTEHSVFSALNVHYDVTISYTVKKRLTQRSTRCPCGLIKLNPFQKFGQPRARHVSGLQRFPSLTHTNRAPSSGSQSARIFQPRRRFCHVLAPIQGNPQHNGSTSTTGPFRNAADLPDLHGFFFS
jgi:hypothetical protein